MSHYASLFIGYAVALTLWLATLRAFRRLWPRNDAPLFQRPWFEVACAVVACVGIICIGQLYVRGWLLPRLGPFKPLTETLNQALIFSPIAVLLFVCGQSPATAWLPTNEVWKRVLIGVSLGNAAIVAYLLARENASSWAHAVLRTYDPRNLPLLTQVLFEDITIAVLFVRFSAVIGARPSVAIVGLLFAAGHVPTMMTEGATLDEFARLVFDAALATAGITVLRRSADVWWFWGVHYAMDMMQFHGATN